MRKYMDEKKEKLEVRCNKCGRLISVRKDMLCEDLFHAEKIWGYFSGKDGTKHSWDLCEACYETLVKGFVIPPEELEVTELL